MCSLDQFSEPEQRLMKNKKVFLVVCLICIVSVGVGKCVHQTVFVKKKLLTILRSFNSQNIRSLKIYPGVVRPVGKAVEIFPPDPLIESFVLSFADTRSFDSFANIDIEHSFFLEILGEGVVIQVVCHIASQNDGRFLGGFVKLQGRSTWYYGGFQSELLFQWYQKYSHRWLTPEDDRDSD